MLSDRHADLYREVRRKTDGRREAHGAGAAAVRQVGVFGLYHRAEGADMLP
jgi:hypothetical protein